MVLKALRLFRLFLVGLASTILLDMFVFKAFLKNLLVRANTSDVSPFSTDGQSNYILIIVAITAVAVISYILYRFAGEPDAEEEDKKDDIEDKH
jgi:hypothetical protein